MVLDNRLKENNFNNIREGTWLHELVSDIAFRLADEEGEQTTNFLQAIEYVKTALLPGYKSTHIPNEISEEYLDGIRQSAKELAKMYVENPSILRIVTQSKNLNSLPP